MTKTHRDRSRPHAADGRWAWRPGVALGLIQAPAYCMLLLPPLSSVGTTGPSNCLPAIAAFFIGLACSFALSEIGWHHDFERVKRLFGGNRALSALGCAGWALLATAQALASFPAASTTAQVLGTAGALAAGFSQAHVTLSYHRLCAGLTREAGGKVALLSAAWACLICIAVSLLPAPTAALACAACFLAGTALEPEALHDVPPDALEEAPNRRAVLGDPLARCCFQAAVVMACSSMMAACVLWVAGSHAADGPFEQAKESVALALALAASVLAMARLTHGRPSTISLTLVFRLSLTPLFLASALCLVLASMRPAAVGLCAFGLVVMDQGHRIISVGFLRSGIFHEGVLVALARLGQAAGVLVATLLAWLLPADALVVAGLLLTCATGAAFVLCVPSYEARLAGGGSDSLLPDTPDDLDNVEHYMPAALQFGLTTRELEVFALLAEGLGASEIAKRLFVSRATVNTHIQHIYAKADVHSKAELLAKAWVAPPAQGSNRT